MSENYASMELPFGPDVYAANLALLARDIRAQGLSAAILFDPENIYWLTGYRSIGYFTFQCLVVTADGRISMVSRQVNHAVATGNRNIARFIAIDDVSDPVEVLAAYLKDILPSGRIGLETTSGYLSVAAYKQLLARLDARLADWQGPIEEARKIKTPAQLGFMRQAAQAAVAGIDAAVQSIAVGATENDLAAAMLHGATKAGSEYTRVPLVAVGHASGVCFTTWQRRELKRGDLVFLEAAANINRYHAMISRNCVVGRATERQRFLAGTVIAALDAAIDAIRPGVRSAQVDQACRAVFERAGLAHYFDHRTAYGIGIGFPPNWAEGRFLALRPDDPTVLEPGMTFHLVPSLFMPEGGFMASESVAVAEDGCEVLTRYPRELIEIDA